MAPCRPSRRACSPGRTARSPARSFGASWGTKKVVGKCQATINRIVTAMRIIGQPPSVGGSHCRGSRRVGPSGGSPRLHAVAGEPWGQIAQVEACDRGAPRATARSRRDERQDERDDDLHDGSSNVSRRRCDRRGARATQRRWSRTAAGHSARSGEAPRPGGGGSLPDGGRPGSPGGRSRSAPWPARAGSSRTARRRPTPSRPCGRGPGS